LIHYCTVMKLIHSCFCKLNWNQLKILVYFKHIVFKLKILVLSWNSFLKLNILCLFRFIKVRELLFEFVIDFFCWAFWFLKNLVFIFPDFYHWTKIIRILWLYHTITHFEIIILLRWLSWRKWENFRWIQFFLYFNVFISRFLTFFLIFH